MVDRVHVQDLVEESNQAIETLRRLVSRLEIYTDQLEEELERQRSPEGSPDDT